MPFLVLSIALGVFLLLLFHVGIGIACIFADNCYLMFTGFVFVGSGIASFYIFFFAATYWGWGVAILLIPWLVGAAGYFSK